MAQITRRGVLLEIEDYKKLLKDPNTSDNTKAIAKGEIAELEAMLKDLPDESEPPPAPAPRQKGRPKKEKVPKMKKDGTARAERAPKERVPYGPGHTTTAGQKITNENGDFLDKNGQIVAVGDMVTARGKTGTVKAVASFVGDVHKIETSEGKPLNVFPSEVQLHSVDVMKPIKKDIIKKAETVDRKDCDENEMVLITPKEKTKIDAPLVADPAKGDKILANKQGHAIAVVTGKAAKNDYKTKGKAKAVETPKGNVAAFVNDATSPEEAAKKEDKEAPKKYNDVKARKPQKGCTTTRDAAKSPALKTFLDGMVMRWHSGDSMTKIERVFFDNDAKKITLEMDVYTAMDWNKGLAYYHLCAESGKTTKLAKKPAELSLLISKDGMKAIYAKPYGATCSGVSQALYSECYKKGTCSTERQKRLYAVMAGKCARQIGYAQEYMKWLHKKTAEKWGGPDSGTSYVTVFKKVAADARAGKL